MERTCLNISTDLAQRAIYDQKLLDAVVLNVGIKMIRIHGAWKTGEGKIMAIVNMFKCSTRTAQRVLNAARELRYIYEGKDYIKTTKKLVHFEEDWSRRTKEHGKYNIKTSFILHIPVLNEGTISFKAIINSLRDELVFNAIRHDIHKSEEGNTSNKTMRKNNPAYLPTRQTRNITTELIAKITGQSKSSAKNRLNRLEKEGKINIFRNKIQKIGEALDKVSLPLCAFVIGAYTFSRQPNAYSFNDYNTFNSATHVILNHNKRVRFPQKEAVVIARREVIMDRSDKEGFLLDATNPSLPIKAYYDASNYSGHDNSGVDDDL